MKIRRKSDRKRSDVYVQSLVVRSGTTGFQEIHVCIGGEDIGELKQAVLASFQSTLECHLSSPDFGGEIVIAILGQLTPQTPALWRAMTDMEEQLKGVITATGMRTAGGHPVQLRFHYTSRQD
jgi:hypothetical protein